MKPKQSAQQAARKAQDEEDTKVRETRDLATLVEDIRKTRKEIARLAQHLMVTSTALRACMRQRLSDERASAYIMFSNASLRGAGAIVGLMNKVSGIDRIVFSAVAAAREGQA